MMADHAVEEEDALRAARALGERGDAAGEEAALNAFLDRDPLSIRGLIAKADCRVRAGDANTASLVYRCALRLAEAQRLTPDMARDVERGRASLADMQRRTDAARRQRLSQRGLAADTWSPRFRQSLEIAAGTKKAYRQEPTAFDYPGLPHIQYYEARDFEWAARVEAATPQIRAELLALLDAGADPFRPHMHADVAAAPMGGNQALTGSTDWSVLELCENGFLSPEVIERCPRTWETVLSAPVPRISGWGPTIVFSMLKAGAWIAPHSGMFNTRLVCHLPLIVPPGCGFRVGNEVRAWEEGKLLIFDDTIEHEAWNEGTDDRIVLIFDIWRPELSEQEKRELTFLFSD